MTTIDFPQIITVKVPSVAPVSSVGSPRATAVRAAYQNTLNRSVPAINQYDSPPTSRRSRQIRTAPGGPVAATNESAGRVRSGQPRQAAKTSVVNFSNISLQPTERRNVRGIYGFFPSSVLRSEESVKRKSTSPQPSQTTSPPSTARGRSRARHHSPHNDQPPTPLNAQDGKDYHAILRREQIHEKKADSRQTKNTPTSSTTIYKAATGSKRQTDSGGLRRRDAAWIKAFKVKQKRNSKMKDMLESRSTPNLQGDGFLDW